MKFELHPGFNESIPLHDFLKAGLVKRSFLDELQQAIVSPFAPQDITDSGFLVTDARHYDLLTRAGSEVAQSLAQMNQKMSEEIVLIGLHNALRYLGQITGETTTEDMLTRIFATFCIGK